MGAQAARIMGRSVETPRAKTRSERKYSKNPANKPPITIVVTLVWYLINLIENAAAIKIIAQSKNGFARRE